MKLVRWFLLIALTSPVMAQQIAGAYVSPSAGVWNPWSAGAAWGQIGVSPNLTYMYCQASAGAAWTPCNPSSGGGATLPFPGIVYATSSNGGTVATGAQVASAIAGQTITPSAVGSPSMTPQAIDCHTACSPTAAQLSNAMVANFGQGASNVAITGPTAAAGMNFIMIAGTAQASNYWQYTSTTANIYLDGSATAKTTITFAAPAIGNSFSCFSFQTGAGPTYSLKCTTLAGTSTSS